MKVLISGGAGFIGSHLVDRFLNEGAKVIVVDNLITGLKSNIAAHFNNKDFEFINQDVCESLPTKDKVDLILHLASPASPFDYLKYPIETMRTASIGTFNMLELARKNGARFLLASTSEVYGDPQIHPQTEKYWGNVNPVGPRSVYDEGKRFAEALTAGFYRKYKLPVVIIRIFNTYGPRMRPGDGRVIPTFINQALRNEPISIFGDGNQTRSFCYVDDMVEGICRASQVNHSQPINLGNPREYTILQLAEIVKNLCQSTSQYKFLPLPQDDPQKRKPDITKAKKLLQWEPKIELEQGLKNVIEWFKKENQSILHKR